MKFYETIYKSKGDLSEKLLSVENDAYQDNMKKYIEKIEVIKSPDGRNLIHIYMPIGHTNKFLLFTDAYVYYEEETQKNIGFLKEGRYLIQIGGIEMSQECRYYRCNHGAKFHHWIDHSILIDKICRKKKIPRAIMLVV